MSYFAREILNEIEKIIDPSSIITLVPRPINADPSNPDFKVKLVHKSSRIEVACSAFESHVENKAMALILMRQKLNEMEK